MKKIFALFLVLILAAAPVYSVEEAEEYKLKRVSTENAGTVSIPAKWLISEQDLEPGYYDDMKMNMQRALHMHATGRNSKGELLDEPGRYSTIMIHVCWPARLSPYELLMIVYQTIAANDESVNLLTVENFKEKNASSITYTSSFLGMFELRSKLIAFKSGDKLLYMNMAYFPDYEDAWITMAKDILASWEID